MSHHHMEVRTVNTHLCVLFFLHIEKKFTKFCEIFDVKQDIMYDKEKRHPYREGYTEGNMSKKVVIIGGVAGGASTAARLRRNDETIEIIMFEKGKYISFANCGLPYHIGGSIEERDNLLLQTPEAFNQRFNVDVRVLNEVLSIDKEKKSVEVKRLETGEIYHESYDTLVLSPGSTPIQPPIKGIESDNIHVLWNMDDMDKIIDHIKQGDIKSTAVIGGGFIGIEMAENLHDLKMQVSLVEMANQVMTPVDFDMAQGIHAHMRAKGLNLILSDGVNYFEEVGGQTKIVLNSGKELLVDMVILSIGVRPQSKLAKEADLSLNERGGIVVNKYMKTSDDNIYALGDAVEIEHFMTKEPAMIPLAGPANKQGRIVADNIAGKKVAYKGTQGTSIAKVFDLTVANTGLNEKDLIRAGKQVHKDYETLIIHPKSNAGYYPGAFPMTLKTIFDMEGKILGAQITGYRGVDKRIDVIATAMRFNGSVYDLKDLELAYAPPFSSAKAPENMVGFAAENLLTGVCPTVNWHEIESLQKQGAVLLDVRTKEEVDLGAIKGSIHIEVDELRDRLGELDKSKKYIIYCAVGIRGYIALRILKENGFKDVYNLTGGYSTYNCVVCQKDDDDHCSGQTCCNDECDIDRMDDNLPLGDEVSLNACGLACPGPIREVYKAMDNMKDGDVLNVKATDPGFGSDINRWADKMGHKMMDSGFDGNSFYAKIQKGQKPVIGAVSTGNNKSMVVFSDDLDKAIASFIIANGAAAMGRKVTMFFTFWGLNVIKKHESVKVNKNIVGRMFSKMLPRGSKKLTLSKMNMAGVGGKMIRGLMKKHNVDSLEELIKQAIDAGVNIVACNMSMDLMGVHEDELIEGVNLGGVATYLAEGEESDINLFI